MAKIIGIVTGCKGCPNRRYYSGGRYECSLVEQVLAPEVLLPSWCPLAEHPATEISQAQTAVSDGRAILEVLKNELTAGGGSARMIELVSVALERFPQVPT